jgi:hypothetical protein
MSLSFNAYTGKVIDCSHNFTLVFGDFAPGSFCFSLFKSIQPFWKTYQAHVDDIQCILEAQADSSEPENSDAMEMATARFSHIVILEHPSSSLLPIQYQAHCFATLESSEFGKDHGDAEEFGVVAHIVLKDLKLCRASGKNAVSL